MNCPECNGEMRIIRTIRVGAVISTADRICTKCGKQHTTINALATMLDLPPGSAYKLAQHLRDQFGPVNNVRTIRGGPDS